jgi:proteasome lid subunit RPN8/RPN11
MILAAGKVLEAIRAHGSETYPEECCGALLGSLDDGGARIARAERLANTRGDQRTRRFLIDPEEYRRVERSAEAGGLALLGFYHSHPDHPAVPSEYDREHALPFFHYVVVAVSPRGAEEVTAWRLSADRRTLERETLMTESTGG